MRFEIYRNYGVLAAEKRNIYTYRAEHPNATCSDIIKAELPENNSFKMYRTVMGDLAVESSWGFCYGINEVLWGDKKPCFYALDKDGKGHRVCLEEIE